MKTICMAVLLGATSPAMPETILQCNRIEDVFILNQIYLNEQGPYRMIVDTGNSSSIVRPAVAERLGLRPAYLVEMETASGVKQVPAAILGSVRAGSSRDEGIEVMIADVAFEGADGILGQSWLARHDYLLDYRHHRLVMDAAAPPGIQLSLEPGGGRPHIAAEVNGRRQQLVLDSGSTMLVLFGWEPSRGGARLVTNTGSIAAERGSARVTIGGSLHKRLPTAQAGGPAQPGLLPTAAFRAVYISSREGVAVVVP